MNFGEHKALQQANNIVKATDNKLDNSKSTKDIMQKLVAKHQPVHMLIKIKGITYITTYQKKSIPILIVNLIYKHQLIAKNILVKYNKELTYVGECWTNDWLYIKGKISQLQIAPQEQRYIITDINHATFCVACPFDRVAYTYPNQDQIHYFYAKRPRLKIPSNANLLLGYTIIRSKLAVLRNTQNGKPLFSQYIKQSPLMKYAVAYMQWANQNKKRHN